MSSSPISDQLRALRKRRGLSQAAVASAVDRSPATVSQWEAGKQAVPSDLLELAAAVLGARVTLESPAASDAEAVARQARSLDADAAEIARLVVETLPRLSPPNRAALRALVEAYRRY